MKKEWIKSDEEIQAKRAKKKHKNDPCKCHSCDCCKTKHGPTDHSPESLTDSHPMRIESSPDQQEPDTHNSFVTELNSITYQRSPTESELIQSHLHQDYCFPSSPSSYGLSISNVSVKSPDSLSAKENGGLPSWVLEQAVKTEFTELPFGTVNKQEKKLNSLEMARLDELVAAYSIVRQPFSPCVEICVNFTLNHIVKITDHAIRMVIKMAKKLTSFKKLCEEDQVALLKAGSLEIIILRGVLLFVRECEGIQVLI